MPILRIQELAGVILFAAAAVGGLAAQPVQVDTVTDAAPSPLVVKVHWTELGGGARRLEVDLTNPTNHVVALRRAEVALPWGEAGADTLICAGASRMGDQHPRIALARQGPVESGSYLMTHSGTHSSLAGLLTLRRFVTTLVEEGGTLRLNADGEGRLIVPGETVPLEPVWFAPGNDWQGLLWGYAKAVAEANRVRLAPAPRYVGWSTWDYFARHFTGPDITKNMVAIRQVWPDTDLIQIDGGWWSRRGEFRARANLPSMPEVAAEIARQHCTAGVHLDGMRAEQESEVVRRHPEYFLHDENGRMIVDGPRPQGDGDVLGYAYFDYSQPGARAYFRDGLRSLREAGFRYFKIDFLRLGLRAQIQQAMHAQHPGLEVVPHDRHLTSVERTQLALAAFREGMGDDAYFLGCSSVFGTTFGHVDALRVGADISPNFKEVTRVSLEYSGAFYLQGTVVRTDTDYLVVRGPNDQDSEITRDRSKHGTLSETEARTWMRYVSLLGSHKLESDDLPVLGSGRMALLREAAGLPWCRRFVPVDFWQHNRNAWDPPQAILGEAAESAYLALFNWTASPVTWEIGAPPATHLPATVRLEPHDSAVLRIPPPVRFDYLRTAVTAAPIAAAASTGGAGTGTSGSNRPGTSM